ncbi:hypothetical protein BGZ47_011486 [Haplosporangium gracile]|nr:hypothetical protein BGZ47_011486 [Haplosporangium gracile]
MATTDTQLKPTVLIVGAGIGGVMLGALLEKAHIPYLIFERATTVKPLGSALAVSSPLMQIFEQLSIYDDLRAIGKPSRLSQFVTEKKETLVELDFIVATEYTGYGGLIVSRPAFYDLLLKQIPAHKIFFGKRVQTIKDEGDKVEIQMTTGEIYKGDILVGADGAYSTVRKSLYEALDKVGKLPASDLEDLPFKSTCLVGQTEPLDPEQYPQVLNLTIPFYSTLGENSPYTWTLFTTLERRIAWMTLFHHPISSKTAEERRANDGENVEWGPNAAQAMMDKTRDFPIIFGDGKRTLGDMYDLTPKDLISKVSLEEKIFETWSGGRVVLLGDACHKLNPAGGQGALTSMHDAVALANLIYALPLNHTTANIEQSFSEYRTERYPAAVEAFNGSLMLAKFMDKGISGKIALLVAQWLPGPLWRLFVKKRVMLRPQAGFLEEVKNKGSVKPTKSESTEKARRVYVARKSALNV